MGRADCIVFGVLACTAGVYVIARAILVPVVHDEAMAYHKYVQTGEFVPFVAEWGAGNHVLYSALAQVSYFLFGPALFALRSWSVLAFVLYASYVRLFGIRLRAPLVRWCAWSALLWTPFMLEFFSLARGYGVALGCWTMALYHVLCFMDQGKQRDLLLGLVGSTLAMWSLLSMVMVVCAVLVVTFTFIMTDRSIAGRGKLLLWWLVIGVLPWTCAVLFAKGMQEHGAFYAGSDRGYVWGTLASLLQSVLRPGINVGGAILTGVIVVPILGYLSLSGRAEDRGRRLALFLIAGIFLFEVVAQSGAHLLLGSRTPMDRAALYVVPLLLLLCATALDAVASPRPWLRYAVLTLLFVPARAVKDANVDHTLTWPEQAIPERFFDLVAERQADQGRPLIVGAQQFLANATWSFGARSHGGWLNELDPVGFPQPWCDLLMIDTTAHMVPDGFRTIADAPGGRNRLMERVVPLRVALRVDSIFGSPMSKDEFRLLWEVKSAPWKGKNLILEMSAAIISERGTTDSEVFARVDDGTGAHLYEHQFNIDHQRGSSNNGRYRVGMRLPTIDDRADHITFCVYDPLRRRFSMEDVRVRVWEILP